MVDDLATSARAIGSFSYLPVQYLLTYLKLYQKNSHIMPEMYQSWLK